MPKFYNDFIFDEEIFSHIWQTAPDPVFTAMLQSGAIVSDATISAQVQNGGSKFTLPFYDVLDPTGELNYDGVNDLTTTGYSSDKQSGTMWHRMRGWALNSFVATITGDDPWQALGAQIGVWRNKQKQRRLIGILNAILGVTGNAEWDKHKTNLATTTSAVGDANKVNVDTINNAITAANGDHKSLYSMAIMHSAVANRLANLQLLEYWKGTDANGIQRPMNIASINGLTVVIDDGVPVAASANAPGQSEYTTFILGNGVIRHADVPTDNPSTRARDEEKFGGVDKLYIRYGEAMHPNGFNWKGNPATDSPTDAELFASANWEVKFNPKAIPIARLITNG